MKMTFKWYGRTNKISLKHIAQISGIYGIVTILENIETSLIWLLKEIQLLKYNVETHNLKLEVIAEC